MKYRLVIYTSADVSGYCKKPKITNSVLKCVLETSIKAKKIEGFPNGKK